MKDSFCGKPLTFGDKKQIDAIKELEHKAELNEQGIEKYTVRYVIQGEIEIEVEARNIDEAKRLAQDELDDMDRFDKMECCDIDFESIEVRN